MDTLKKLIKNKYLTLVLINKSKEKINKLEELWSKIRYLIRLTKNWDDYDEKHMKIKFDSDDELPLNKTMEIPSMIIVARAIFLKNSKCYPEVSFDAYLYKILKWKIKMY